MLTIGIENLINLHEHIFAVDCRRMIMLKINLLFSTHWEEIGK